MAFTSALASIGVRTVKQTLSNLTAHRLRSTTVAQPEGGGWSGWLRQARQCHQTDSRFCDDIERLLRVRDGTPVLSRGVKYVLTHKVDAELAASTVDLRSCPSVTIAAIVLGHVAERIAVLRR